MLIHLPAIFLGIWTRFIDWRYEVNRLRSSHGSIPVSGFNLLKVLTALSDTLTARSALARYIR
jgi:hypothetical protein